MGKPGEGFTYNYNPQISVDSDTQIIVGQHISQKANDKEEVEPALEKIEEATGQQAGTMTLDNGYHSGHNLKALEVADIEAYMAINKGEKSHPDSVEESTRRLQKSDFSDDESKDYFICPAKQVLPLVQTKKDGRKIYQGDKNTCATCPYQARCCQSKKGAARSISSDHNEGLRQRMCRTMESKEGRWLRD